MALRVVRYTALHVFALCITFSAGEIPNLECDNGARLPDFPSALPSCGESIENQLTNIEKRYEGPVIPKPSTSCGSGDVVKGWCLEDAHLLPKQPPPKRHYTDAECCALCVAEPTCRAWNTNARQVRIAL